MLNSDAIKTALDKIRPQLQEDGGDLEYVGLEDETKVLVKLTGACGSCPMATMTLKEGVEAFLKQAFPGEELEVVQAF